MSKCRFCGKSAGLFSNVHKECEELHEKACRELSVLFDGYFHGRSTSSEVADGIRSRKMECHISDEDVARIGSDALKNYCRTLHRPYQASVLGIANDFILASGVPCRSLNSNGAVDEIAAKLMKGFIADFFTDMLPLDKALGRCERIRNAFNVSESFEHEVFLEMLEKASVNFMKDGVLTDSEQRHIDEYVSRTGISMSNLPEKYQNSEIAKIGQASVLRDFRKGIYPVGRPLLPVLLGKNEHVLWVYNGVSMYMEKVERETVGRSSGVSVRLCKGVTYRVGQFKGHPVEHSRMNLEGNGALIVTDKNLFFYSQQKTCKIPFSKIVGITPYSDGVEVHRDGNAKRLVFEGFDSWFIMNLLSMADNG